MPHINRNTNQSIFDVAILHTGSIAAAYTIAVENNIPIALVANGYYGEFSVLKVPGVSDQNIIDVYDSKGIIPATGYDNWDSEGIDGMRVDVDFVVG
jgi:hypothetical protein